jgi:glucose/arabinose dehydrogenase
LRFEPLEPRFAPATLLPGFVESPIVSGLTAPTTMALAPDGKLFVAEQAGTLEIWQNGSRLQPDFFRDAPRSVDPTGERGLLGVAFDPNYLTNRFVYAYYTTTDADHHNRVSRFTANAAGDLALNGSELVLLELDPHAATNHNGGAIHFGPDGKLYIAAGDNANGANSQSLATLHGKILRINADGSIPGDNPFLAQTTGKNQAIWALGLRNPFSFAFEAGTGRMLINDVGANAWEEINLGAAGANYGWPQTEGDFNQTAFPGYTRPRYAYSHDPAVTTPSGTAIVGGAFYNPQVNQFGAAYSGDYFFADLGGNFIYRLDPTTGAATSFATNAATPVDLAVDPLGNLYYLARGSGQVFRVSTTAGPQSKLDTIGLYDPSSSLFYLRLSNTSGFADQTVAYGIPGAGWLPIVGDWNGDGTDTIGLYDPGNSVFYLRNTNTSGNADLTFGFGNPGAGWLPLVGDWNGDGTDTIGLYDPSQSLFFLRNSNTTGYADLQVGFGPGGAGWRPVVGNWDGFGGDSIGLFDPTAAVYYLKNTTTTGFADQTFSWGSIATDARPLGGDWNGNGTATVGLYRPSDSVFRLADANGTAHVDSTVPYGQPGANWLPVVGDFNGPAPASALLDETDLTLLASDVARHGSKTARV